MLTVETGEYIYNYKCYNAVSVTCIWFVEAELLYTFNIATVFSLN